VKDYPTFDEDAHGMLNMEHEAEEAVESEMNDDEAPFLRGANQVRVTSRTRVLIEFKGF
jgi:hypothetical protein